MPNPGKSIEEKRLTGSRLAGDTMPLASAPVRAIPEPARRLEESGLNLWRQAFGRAETWLTDTDLELLLITCEKLDERDLLRVFVMENIEAWHERAGLRVLEKQIEENLTLLGFTPTARQKLGIQHVKAQSKFEQLMAKKQTRQD